MESYRKPRNPNTLQAALTYARCGIPVFPLQPGGKEPLIKDWPNRATTDPTRINMWWHKWPYANIAIPTGERSGLLALDVDPDAGGADALADLERNYGELPPTTTVRTGGGGTHYYLAYPTEVDVGNSAGKLGPGLDVRGEGGYIVAPPSRTTGPYKFLQRHGRADPPEWMLARFREAQRCPTGLDRGNRHPPGPVPLDTGGPISTYRNVTLTSIAGRLHDGSLDLARLSADLMAINEERCTPPLPRAEVEKIASSIHKTEPCKPAAPQMTPETLETLNLVEAVLWRRDWQGMGGKSERDVYAALIVAARRCGTLIPAGVRVSIDLRSLALAAAVSKRALLDSRKNGERKPGILNRLKRRGLIRPDNANRGQAKAGAFVLLTPRAEFHHSPTAGGYLEPGVTCGETLRAPRLRWSAPETKRLGKTRGALIDALQRAGGTLTVADLTAAGGINRGRDLRRRLLPDLEAAGVVECSGDAVSLTEDWNAALDRAREIGGEIAALRRDMVRYNLQRTAYANRHMVKPGRAPTTREMDLTRWGKLKPSGRISSLARESPVFAGVFVRAADDQRPLEEEAG